MKGVYDEMDILGMGRHTIEEVLDVYLDSRNKLLSYQTALM
jgi:hypothetical protein